MTEGERRRRGPRQARPRFRCHVRRGPAALGHRPAAVGVPRAGRSRRSGRACARRRLRHRRACPDGCRHRARCDRCGRSEHCGRRSQREKRTSAVSVSASSPGTRWSWPTSASPSTPFSTADCSTSLRIPTGRQFVDALRASMPLGARYYMLCFSDLEPGDWGPRASSRTRSGPASATAGASRRSYRQDRDHDRARKRPRLARLDPAHLTGSAARLAAPSRGVALTGHLTRYCCSPPAICYLPGHDVIVSGHR